MSYEILQASVLPLLEVFNNPLGIGGVVIAVFVSLLMCVWGGYKGFIGIGVITGLVILLGSLACIVTNKLSYLWVPILFVPFFITFVFISVIYYIMKWIVCKIRKKTK